MYVLISLVFLLVAFVAPADAGRRGAEISLRDQSRIDCVCREIRCVRRLELTLRTNCGSAAIDRDRGARIVDNRAILRRTRRRRTRRRVRNCAAVASGACNARAAELSLSWTARRDGRRARRENDRFGIRQDAVPRTVRRDLDRPWRPDNDQPDTDCARVGQCVALGVGAIACFSARRGGGCARWFRASSRAPARATRRPDRSAACWAARSAASSASSPA